MVSLKNFKVTQFHTDGKYVTIIPNSAFLCLRAGINSVLVHSKYLYYGNSGGEAIEKVYLVKMIECFLIISLDCWHVYLQWYSADDDGRPKTTKTKNLIFSLYESLKRKKKKNFSFIQRRFMLNTPFHI